MSKTPRALRPLLVQKMENGSPSLPSCETTQREVTSLACQENTTLSSFSLALGQAELFDNSIDRCICYRFFAFA